MSDPLQSAGEAAVLSPPDGESAETAAPVLGLSPGRAAWRRFRSDKVGLVCLGVVALYVLLGVFAPVIAAIYGKSPYVDYGENIPSLLTQNGYPAGANGGIGGQFWFGITPQLGTDVFTGLLYGIRTSLIIAVSCVLITTLIGMSVGLTVGYLGGKVDRGYQFIANVMLAFPALLLMIALQPVVDSRLVPIDQNEPVWMQFVAVIVILSLFGWIAHSMVLRSMVRSLREREFVKAARALGLSRRRIIFTELLPNLWGPVLVHVTMAVPAYVAYEATMSYLGLGIAEPIPDWGRMIADASNQFFADPTYLIFPGAALLIFVLAFNLLGDAVRDALDPRSG